MWFLKNVSFKHDKQAKTNAQKDDFFLMPMNTINYY